MKQKIIVLLVVTAFVALCAVKVGDSSIRNLQSVNTYVQVVQAHPCQLGFDCITPAIMWHELVWFIVATSLTAILVTWDAVFILKCLDKTKKRMKS